MKKILLTLLVFFAAINTMFAQVPPPPDYHENATPGAPSLPVDQYVFYLIAIAISVGAYFIWQKRKVINQF